MQIEVYLYMYSCCCVSYTTGTFLHSAEVVVMPWQPVYRVLPNLTIVCSWDTLWVSPSTSMQVAMVMASQFVMMYVWLPFQYCMILAHGQVGESIIAECISTRLWIEDIFSQSMYVRTYVRGGSRSGMSHGMQDNYIATTDNMQNNLKQDNL